MYQHFGKVQKANILWEVRRGVEDVAPYEVGLGAAGGKAGRRFGRPMVAPTGLESVQCVILVFLSLRHFVTPPSSEGGKVGGASRTSPPTRLNWVRCEARRGVEGAAPYKVGLGAV